MSRSMIALLITILSVVPCLAQTYPNRTIRVISPYAPGGGTDIVARLLAQKLSENIGQSVVVDNRSGGGGIVGTDAVAKSAPDGYTLLLASPGPVTVNPSLYKKLPYDTLRDFAPITLVSIIPSLLGVHPSLPVKSVQALISYAKARPGQLGFSSSGNGGSPHLAGEMFNVMAGVKMVHVPYRGTGPAILAVVSGEVPLTFGNVFSIMPHIKSERLRGLAVTSLKRSRVVPDLPTIAESGLAGYEAMLWYGVLTPTGTPKEIITRLNNEFVKILKHPDMQKKLSEDGGDVVASSPEEFTKHMKSELVRWAKIIKDANIHAD